LVAGPIERPQNLIHQFRENHAFDHERISSGLRLMAWGFFKKVVIADRLATVVNHVYSDPHHFNGISLVIATFFYTYQIYCDFSGYSDIAIGSARIMGIKLMQNFNNPYQSKSFRELWTRWHISLSTWLRDYLFNPLGGYHKGIPRGVLNLFIVFLIFGLWHGPKWTFIAMGAIQGFYLTFGILTRKPRNYLASLCRIDKIPLISVITTFCLINYSFIFFRADTISDAFYMARHIFSAVPDTFHFHHLQYMGVTNGTLVFSVVLIIFLELIQYLEEHYTLSNKFIKQPIYVRWAVYYLALFLIGVYGVYEHREFIYFQF
jgi:alginate O-acetyltransferase complex protein AlgI